MCRQARVPFVCKSDVEITLSVSTDIQHIEVKFWRDEEDRAKKKPMDITLVVDVENHESGAVETTSESGIPSFSPSLPSSSTLAPSLSAHPNLKL